jgi:hypothetical protein
MDVTGYKKKNLSANTSSALAVFLNNSNVEFASSYITVTGFSKTNSNSLRLLNLKNNLAAAEVCVISNNMLPNKVVHTLLQIREF